MDLNQQAKSLCRFVNKRMRERLFFELSRPDKRLRGIARFSHRIENFIRSDTVLACGEQLTADTIIELVKDRGENCLILSDDSPPDGEQQPFCQAVKTCWFLLGTRILLCGRYAVVMQEQETGASNKIVLYAP